MRRHAGTDLGRAIAIVLRAGTACAVVGIAAGFGLALLDGTADLGPTPVIDAIRAGGPDALIGVGLLALTLTPPAALVAAGIVLYRAGERRYALVAAIVLLLLMGSFGLAAVIGPAI